MNIVYLISIIPKVWGPYRIPQTNEELYTSSSLHVFSLPLRLLSPKPFVHTMILFSFLRTVFLFSLRNFPLLLRVFYYRGEITLTFLNRAFCCMFFYIRYGSATITYLFHCAYLHE